jgi:hypothetical protein
MTEQETGHPDDTANFDAARLSRLLFAAREQIDMWGDVVQTIHGRRDRHTDRVRDDIDAYRAERGWSPNGFGGEV